MFKNSGLIKDEKNNCKIVTIIEILKKKFTILILFNPEVQSIKNSLSFSNFRTVKNKPIHFYGVNYNILAINGGISGLTFT